MNPKRKWTWLIALSLLIAVGGFLSEPLVDRAGTFGANIFAQLGVLRDVLVLVRDNYVNPTDSSELIDGAVEGILTKLDPHCSFVKADDYKRMAERFQGEYEGIGISFDIRDGVLTVIAPLPGGPSERLGIRPGDQIVKINGKSAIGIKTHEVLQKLKGPKGTKVAVSIRREGVEDLIELEIVREAVSIESVPYHFILRPGVGYIRIIRFSKTTGAELEKALRELEYQGMKKLLLDLRWNAGGLLSAAIDVSGKFIGGGKKIVYTRGRVPGSSREYPARSRGARDLPIIVMINHASASASEIVSGAIQDWDRGLIVGQTSFGKGLVQNQFALSGGDVLLLTISRYYTPSGRLIQRPYTDDRMAYIEEGYDDEDPNIAVDEADSNRHVYTTIGGRKVYGGGGITPDVSLERDLTDPFEWKLMEKRAFFEYAGRCIAEHQSFPEDFDSFLSAYEVPDERLADFKAFLKEKDIDLLIYDLPDPIVEKFGEALRAENFSSHADFIKRGIKKQIAGRLWGDKERYRVAIEGDQEVTQAMALFDQAEALMAYEESSHPEKRKTGK
ncbi:MAG: S41 family peptidase [Candidatus Latescibacteria bacterium]|nr:S41 family peptidase [Candidatus Latescibacterota bacterium]